MKGRSFDVKNLSKLTFFDKSFEYDAASYSYKDIKHIKFFLVATKHSTNFIPTGTTYEADLRLDLQSGKELKILQEDKIFNRRSKESSEAICIAASIFSDITFDQRLKSYEDELRKKGFFTWQNYQITKSGDLFKNHILKFNLKDRRIKSFKHPFSLEYHPRADGIWQKVLEILIGNSEFLDTSVDRDCFFYLMKWHIGLTWASEKINSKKSYEKERVNSSDYEILGISSNSSWEEVKLSYKKLVRLYHPDILIAKGSSNAEITESEKMIRSINQAYENISKKYKS
jgi:hypothetical protein